MPYTEFYVTKGAWASDTSGGGPRLGENDGPIYFLSPGAGGATVAEGTETQITDLSGANWAGALIDDWLCWDFEGVKERRRIIDITGAVATVHAACTVGAEKGVTVGGAWATVDYAASTITTAFVNAAGDAPRVNVKYNAAAYAETVLVDNAGTGAIPITYEGYETTAGDGCPNGNLPIINSTGIVCVATFGVSNKNYIHVSNIDLRTTTDGDTGLQYNTSHYGRVFNVKAQATGANSYGITLSSSFVIAVNCQAIGAALDGFYVSNSSVFNCRATGCGRYGFYLHQGAYCVARGLIADNNGGDNIHINSDWMLVEACVCYGSAEGSGIRLNDPTDESPMLMNNILYGNNQFGIEADTAYHEVADWNAFGANGTARSNIDAGIHDVVLTADPFVNAAGGNFALNNAAGGGALCLAAGFPGTLVDAVNIGRADIGALQHRSARRSRGRIHGV